MGCYHFRLKSGFPSPRARHLAWLFAGSLLLRLIVAWPVLQAHVRPVWDEAGYVAQAEGFAAATRALLHGEAPAPEDRDQAYGRGRWPPLHPLVLSLPFLIFGSGVAVARLATVLLSAATTPLVYCLGERGGGTRSAGAAAWIHLLYPSFVGFAHLLWSETLFLLLLASTVLLFLRVPEAGTGGGRLARATLAGALGGVAVLTRIAGAPFVVVLAAWLAWRGRGRERWLQPALALAVTFLTLLPWLRVLEQREGSFHLLTTANGYNLMLGQVPEGPGETGAERKVRVNRMIRVHARETGLPRDHAARDLAMEIIRREPGAFALRALGRIGDLWYGEQHLLRHLFQAVYPPVAPPLAVGLWTLLTVAFAALVALAIRGLLGPGPPLHHRGLWLALVGFGMLPSLPTVASPRMGLPLLFLLLPAAGLGLVRLYDPAPDRRRLGWRFALLCSALLLLQGWRAWHFHTSSSHYAPIQGRLGWPMRDDDQEEDDAEADAGPERPRIGDLLLLRSHGEGCGEIELAARGDEVALEEEHALLAWRPAEQAGVAVRLHGRRPEVPLGLSLACPAEGLAAELDPVRAAAWGRWQAAGLPGVEVMWLSGAEVRPMPEGFPRLVPETAAPPVDSATSATHTP